MKLLNIFYPRTPVVIIDDNSNQEFVKAFHPYFNLKVIQSEFPGRGELLPYIYYLKYKWFPNAVILHDSVFIHRYIPFQIFNTPVLPLWHHTYDKENLNNILRITLSLTNSFNLVHKLTKKEEVLHQVGSPKSFHLCFGSMAYISLPFLEILQEKYHLDKLVHVIHNRTDRCSFERIIGLLFHMECPKLNKLKSLFGDIYTFPGAFGYSFDAYISDLKRKKVRKTLVKVWSGR